MAAGSPKNLKPKFQSGKDMKQTTQGGRRPGSGRKRKGKFPRTRVSITLDPNLVPALRLLTESARATALDTGLRITMPATSAVSFECDIVYQAISEAIQSLERIRDYSPAGIEDDGFYWTPEQAALHQMLNRFWDEIRNAALFSEPGL